MNKSNRQLSARNWFLTFPQSGRAITKDEVLLRLFSKWEKEKFDFIIIAQETHQDGEPHLHLVISFKERLRTRNRGEFDFLLQKHGNYQTVKNIKATIRYVTKSDPQPLKYGNIPDVRCQKDSGKPKQSKSQVVVELLKSGNTLDQIFEEHPAYVLQNKKKIEDLASWLAIKAHRESLALIKYPLSYEGEDTGTRTIVDWLNKNLSSPMPFKEPHLYIHGPTNYCKTSLVNLLGKFIPIYFIPTEDFYDFYQDKDYHLSVLDEFKATKTIQFLNLWLQGSTMVLRKKGSQALKVWNIPTIILSNYSLEECYSKTFKSKNDQGEIINERIVNDKLDTLKGRLLIVELWNPIEVDKIIVTPLFPEKLANNPYIPPEDDSQPRNNLPDCPEVQLVPDEEPADQPATPPLDQFDVLITAADEQNTQKRLSEEEQEDFLQIRKRFKI